ncbi:MAG: hypothetical protein LQ343_004144 [Gyalolechia ehrenbergii]|nr:MAG: hypothetical protein LQ343_004144 [Gyalolechia ehrenbergii]
MTDPAVIPSSSSATDPYRHWTTRTSNLTALLCLSRPSSSPRRPALPPEIILQILSHPTRWLLTHSKSTYDIDVSDQEIPIITLPPVTTNEIQLLRRLIFRFRSKDQGFSWDRQNHGTYGGSWTWFEAVLTGDRDVNVSGSQAVTHDNPRNASDLNVRKKWELQRNRHAGTQFEDYEIVFEHRDARMTELKAAMKEGDVVELRACARYGAWMNHVEEATVELWCLDNLRSRNTENQICS